ncbi:tryptophan synthase beta subunit-like PLP-dependent enzyme [Pseudomassariella vexata]|uniref:Tryptophan synthase beta subunit-like PLP-dependent enzyme n=1 Tax=Pseudomassariella vexata TaxID=1141098 RepID=A0A1Y2DQV6_9PEZI|nr:tryptophan synthase beta subunit-like PLP-dependent enzyme [Pseudomassariella vexata]ORY61524.1 tryptophan synthase beta subunit-like PLP-dependent enzyme [Pseudomassariella vexata]
MANTNYRNVYKGPDSVRDYFNPDLSPPLPLVELPACLNPYRQDGVRIYAKMMTMHPANNVKCMPALNLLENTVVPGKTDTIIEYSSGSTVISMSLISRVYYELPNVCAFLSNKTSKTKLRLMQFFGLHLTLFGGPSQPEPLDERGGIRVAQKMAESSESIVNPNQYENDNNWKAHVRWTGPQILRQLPEINLICAGLGTSGTMTGLGTFFGQAKSSVFRLGVCTAAGDRVPGPRSFSLLAPVEFPWKSAIDHMEHVGSYDSYSWSLKLCRQGLVCGPSSGFNLKGLFQFIEKRKAEGTLSELAGEDGEIHAVFLCCDLPYQYIEEYFEKLGAEHFPEIKNEALTDVDVYRYDDSWEQDPLSALDSFFEVEMALARDVLQFLSQLSSANSAGLASIIPLKKDSIILDLRQPFDFAQFNLPGSINLPFAQYEDQSPFSDPTLLASLWRALDAKFAAPDQDLLSRIKEKRVLVVCYDGDCARVASSILRAHGFEADSLRGGFKALRRLNSGREAPRNMREQAVMPCSPLTGDFENNKPLVTEGGKLAA